MGGIGGVMNNIMLDLECLDSRRTAVLVAIGAVKFDLATGTLGDTFYVEITKNGMQDQIDKGRTNSIDTMIWWMQQSDEARKVFHPKGPDDNECREDIVSALHKFAQFCSSDTQVWGNGVDYDNVVLRDVYETYNIKCPFTYRKNRCYRTFKAMFGNKAKLVRKGEHHNGRDDAITQAEHLIAMHKAIHKNK